MHVCVRAQKRFKIFKWQWERVNKIYSTTLTWRTVNQALATSSVERTLLVELHSLKISISN